MRRHETNYIQHFVFATFNPHTSSLYTTKELIKIAQMSHYSFHLQNFIPLFSVDSRNNTLRQQNSKSVSLWVNLKFKLSDFRGSWCLLMSVWDVSFDFSCEGVFCLFYLFFIALLTNWFFFFLMSVLGRLCFCFKAHIIASLKFSYLLCL